MGDLRHMPHTYDYDIDQLTDVQHLRDLAIQFRQAMLGQHELIDHIVQGDCADCALAMARCEDDLGCAKYQAWSAQFRAALNASTAPRHVEAVSA